MSDQKTKITTPTHSAGATAGVARHGLRLVKSTPKDTDILAEITGTPAEIAAARKSAAVMAKAKDNSLVKQLNGLADAIDAEIAMILKM